MEKKIREEHKQIEETSLQSEIRYRKLFESLRDGCALVNMNGIVKECNETFRQMLGYDIEELKQLSYTDITPGKWHDYEMRIIKEQVLIRGFSEVYEKEYFKKDGTVFPVELRTFLLRNELGENEGMWAIVRDITDRKRTEDRLIESEANFRELFEYSPIGKSLTRLDGSIHVNKAFCEILGYSKEELQIKKWEEITFPDDIPESNKISQSLLEGKISNARFEKRYVHKNGSIIWTDISTYLRWDKEKNPKFFITTITDITDRKRAEEEITFRNLLLSTQMEASLDGILVVDENNTIITFNRRFVEMMSIPQELIEKRSDEAALRFVTDQLEDPQQFLLRVQYLYEHKRETSREELVFKDGRVFDRYSSPMFGPGDHYYGRVWYFRDITMRVQADKELKKRETLLRSYFELPIAGIAITSPTKGWIDVNDHLCEMLGYKREELLRATWSELTHTEDLNLDLDNFNRVHNGEIEGYSIDKRFVRKNGEDIWTSLSVQCVRLSDGKVDYFVALLFDISERKRAEEQLRKNEEKYRSIFDNVQDVYYETLIDGTILEVSPSIEIVSKGQYKRNDLIGKSMFDFYISIEERNAILSILHECGSIMDVEVKLQNKDGSTIHCAISAKLWSDEQGNLKKIIGSMRDITARKKMEIEQFRLLDIIEKSLNEIYVFDSTTLKFEYLNQGALQNIGYTLDEMRNMTPLDIKPLFSGERFKEMIKPLINREKEKIVFETIHQRKDKTEYQAEVHLQLHSSDNKNLFFAVVIDITERKRIEKEINDLNLELEERVIERTNELELKNAELARMNRLFVGRELRMAELKQIIKELEEKNKD